MRVCAFACESVWLEVDSDVVKKMRKSVKSARIVPTKVRMFNGIRSWCLFGGWQILPGGFLVDITRSFV